MDFSENYNFTKFELSSKYISNWQVRDYTEGDLKIFRVFVWLPLARKWKPLVCSHWCAHPLVIKWWFQMMAVGMETARSWGERRCVGGTDAVTEKAAVMSRNCSGFEISQTRAQSRLCRAFFWVKLLIRSEPEFVISQTRLNKHTYKRTLNCV